LATGDEVIKFWKVKVKGQRRCGGMRSNERPSIYYLQPLCFLISRFVTRLVS